MDKFCIATKKSDNQPCKYKKKIGDYCQIHAPKTQEIPITGITITFSECVENHVGMQKLGNDKLTEGFTYHDLLKIKEKWKDAMIICLNDDIEFPIETEKAYILIVKNFIQKNKFHTLINEMETFEWDAKALMRGRVVNKLARQNVCFADLDQEPDYEDGKGRVVAFSHLPILSEIRALLKQIIGDKGKDLLAEGNKYIDISKNGIGYHGDSERYIVIGIRIGAAFPLHYQWFYKHKPLGNTIKLDLQDGDLYIMSSKATGHDWKSSSKITLRHAAGADKYLNLKD